MRKNVGYAGLALAAAGIFAIAINAKKVPTTMPTIGRAVRHAASAGAAAFAGAPRSVVGAVYPWIDYFVALPAITFGGSVASGFFARATAHAVLSVAGLTVVLDEEVGAVGAQQADLDVADNLSYAQIMDGIIYKDTLRNDDGAIHYVGEFMHQQPHGEGRCFWGDQQREALIGRFANGAFAAGHVIDELGVVVGHFRVDEHGSVVVDGWQPERMFTDECAICMDNAPMQSTNHAFASCYHGNICTACASSLYQCPVCRRDITRIVRIV